MRHILLTTDFSKNSIDAINYAVALFMHTECRFHLLHVVKSSNYISGELMSSSTSASLNETVLKSSKDKLENLVEDIKSKNHNLLHTFASIIDYDNLVASINNVVELYQIELIIMGTKGASNFEKIVFGSNTLRVFQRCQVSVLAVPSGAPIKRIKDVLFTTKYESAYKHEDLSILIGLAEHYDYKLDVLHISEEDGLNDNKKGVQQELEGFFRNINHQFVSSNSEAKFLETVLLYIKEHNIEMFSMMRKKHTFLEHLILNHKTQQIAYNLEIPFLMLAYKA
ncbi:universal stress protein [Bizionia argentinensis JUB59]|uniref:Universal stress protein n=1 Tax=Bizionia argentinensis JUB59 TaxID=1046627 RepID=G2EHM8_9FLAO|nr:universal stress protein [Bizionia argentinensis]EGV42062.1 universal stress protein [Bizionia argentinensis JUB59]